MTAPPTAAAPPRPHPHHHAPAPRTRLTARALLALNPGPWIWGQAALVAVAGWIVFATGEALYGMTAGLAAYVGCWNVMLEQRTPGAHRLRCAPVTGAALVASALAGFAVPAAGLPVWATVTGLAVLTLLAYYGCAVLRAAPPGGFLYVLAFSLTCTIPCTPGELPRLAALGAAGAAFGWLVVLAEALALPGAAERRAVARAYRAVGGLVDAAGTDRYAAARHAAVTAVDAAWETVRRGGSARTRRNGTHDRLFRLCRHATVACTAAGALDGTEPADTRRELARAAGRAADAVARRAPAADTRAATVADPAGDRAPASTVSADPSGATGTTGTDAGEPTGPTRPTRPTGRPDPTGPGAPAGAGPAVHRLAESLDGALRDVLAGSPAAQPGPAGPRPAAHAIAPQTPSAVAPAPERTAARPARAAEAAHGAPRPPAAAPAPPTARRPRPPRRYPSPWSALAAGLRPEAFAWRYAVRTALAVAASGGLSAALGVQRPGWAMIAAGSVLLATNSAGTFTRALQRCLGTLAGLVVAAAVLGAGLPTPAVIAVAALCIGAAQPLLAKNSALAMLILTPGVLPLSAAGGGSFAPLLEERLAATALGSAVALLAAVVLWRTSRDRPVRAALADAVLAQAALFGPSADRASHAAGHGTDDGHEPGAGRGTGHGAGHETGRAAPHGAPWRTRQRAVLTALLNAGNTVHRALGDVRPRPSVAALWPCWLAVQNLGFHLATTPSAVLATTPSAVPAGSPGESDRVRSALRALAESLRDGTPPTVADLPPGWATPQIRDGFRLLRTALDRAAAAPGEPGGTAAHVRGRAEDAGGRPLPHAAVTLTDAAGHQVDVGYADADGRFALLPRTAGPHLLIVAGGNGTPPHARHVDVPEAGGSVRPVTSSPARPDRNGADDADDAGHAPARRRVLADASPPA